VRHRAHALQDHVAHLKLITNTVILCR
jgi:hypothetical protein